MQDPITVVVFSDTKTTSSLCGVSITREFLLISSGAICGISIFLLLPLRNFPDFNSFRRVALAKWGMMTAEIGFCF